MHRMWTFTILQLYFHIKMWGIPDSSWKTGTYCCEALFHQVKSELASHNKLFQFNVFQTVFNSYRLLLQQVKFKFHFIKSKVNLPPKISKLLSVSILCLSQFSMADAWCYVYWNSNISSLRNAWWTGLETSSIPYARQFVKKTFVVNIYVQTLIFAVTMAEIQILGVNYIA